MTINTNSSPEAESNPFTVLGEALEAAADSIGDARTDATASAKVAAAKVQSGVSAGAYYTAYGVSYGLVFSGVFIKELLPTNSSIRRGFEQGYSDGSKAAVGAVAKITAGPEILDQDLIDEPATAEAPQA